MPLIEIARFAVAIAVSGVLVWASVSDIRDRKIPNASVLAVLALFLVSVAIERGAGLGSELAAGAIAFAVGFALYWFNIVGAGDSKLFAAVGLFAGLSHLMAFAFATAIAGGLVAVVFAIAQPRRALVMLQLKGQGDFGRGIPYGIAISMAGLLILWGPRLGVNLTPGF